MGDPLAGEPLGDPFPWEPLLSPLNLVVKGRCWLRLGLAGDGGQEGRWEAAGILAGWSPKSGKVGRLGTGEGSFWEAPPCR